MTKPKRDKQGPSLAPQRISRAVWYYENDGNIEVFVSLNDCEPMQVRNGTVAFTIPKYRLKRSLERMERGPRSRGGKA